MSKSSVIANVLGTTFGHNSALFGSNSQKRGLLRGEKRQCFTLLFDMLPFCHFWSKKSCDFAYVLHYFSTCAKMEIPASENTYFFLGNFNISGT